MRHHSDAQSLFYLYACACSGAWFLSLFFSSSPQLILVIIISSFSLSSFLPFLAAIIIKATSLNA
ncbi:hypothetical protein T492DRAFT_983491 [Pavlovales sp. CCMP2436]|nr:hypothetical protein T492DRAFT_983491 [Pavlovales sp. CCMP2436]